MHCITAVLIGLLVMSLAYVVSQSSSNLVGLFVSFSGWIAGPMVGLFTMGIFMSWVESRVRIPPIFSYIHVYIQYDFYFSLRRQGAVIGFLCGWFVVGWIGISAMFSSVLYSPEPMHGRLNVSIDECEHINSTKGYINSNITFAAVNATEGGENG